MGKACRPGRDGVTLAVGDLHAPFMHRDFPRFLAAVEGQFRPTRTVLLGDIVDLHALSRFTRNPIRPIGVGRIEGGPPAAPAGVRPVPRCGRVLGQPRHPDQGPGGRGGHPGRGGGAHARPDRAPARLGVAGAVGHRRRDLRTRHRLHGQGRPHQGGGGEHGADGDRPHSRPRRHCIRGEQQAPLFWGFNVGCGIDRNRYAFAYAKTIPAKPIIGCGVIEAGVPRFVPMTMTRGGRWTGRL
jgi:hypothetical protein